MRTACCSRGSTKRKEILKKKMTGTKTITSRNYGKIPDKVIKHIEQSKFRAFSEVNKALLHAYWNIGKELGENAAYRKSVVEKISVDLG